MQSKLIKGPKFPHKLFEPYVIAIGQLALAGTIFTKSSDGYLRVFLSLANWRLFSGMPHNLTGKNVHYWMPQQRQCRL